MTKRFIILFCISFLAIWAKAQQWTSKDSLNLKRILNDREELKLNPEAIKQIDFGRILGKPRMSEENNRIAPDETLPDVLLKPKVILTLMPYTPTTPFNWDPIYLRKIRVDKDTWRSNTGPLRELCKSLETSGWGKITLEDRMGIRMFGERSNGMMVSTVVAKPLGGINLGNGVYMNGGTIGGLDLMAIFTKDFWDKKGRDRRARTLEVLRTYGDSTSVLINQPLELIQR